MLLEYVALALCICCRVVSGNEQRNATTIAPLRQSVPEGKVFLLELKIQFVRQLPPIVEKSVHSDLKIKCEAVLNFTKVRERSRPGGEEIPLKVVPPGYLDQLVANVRMSWLRRNKTVASGGRVQVRGASNHSTVTSTLRIRDLRQDDEDIYQCFIKNENYENKSSFKLMVTGSDGSESEGELPTYKPLYSDARQTTIPDREERNTLPAVVPVPTASIPKKEINKFEPICQKYVGKQCAVHLKGQYVYIPYTTSQVILERKLAKAFQVTQYSNDISTNCEAYAIPSLCYSTFPICRNPYLTNEIFSREVNDLIVPITNKHSKATLQDIEDGEETEIQFENLPPSGLPSELDPALSGSHSLDGSTMLPLTRPSVTLNNFNYRHNSTVLRRVCKLDCEVLENELCQKEYAIAKRHPHIGGELTLEDCQNLPETDPDCLKIGIPDVVVSEEDCYWESGVGYRGSAEVSNGGSACIVWSTQQYEQPSKYPELTGRHNYCRNPGGKESQPWCFIERDGMHVKQLCDIPKCAHKIWIYIIVVFLVLICLFSTLLMCVCCKNKNKQGATTIRDINLPNADKNIYGNSRLNSPMELTDVMLGNTNSQCNSSRARGNGMLRVPQYTLSQIKFLEELGEGAFGKVYKGALSRGSDTLFVAVKALKENASAKTKADFKREIELISELRHENIVCIVGVALREEPLCMLFEFMARGDLHEFLMGRAPPSGKGLPPLRLLNIACHIASGMQYLAAHHYVHRDLAARNCLVADDFVVKISDFGLSRDIYSSDYYRVQSKSLLPVRWMPPESILYGKFTTESDIWSYGVVLWEIYSYGLQPYYGFSNQEVISMVRGGELLASPASCPVPIYSLMRDCWKHTPQRRPHFDDIANRLQGWIQTGGCMEGSSESSAGSSTPRAPASCGDPRERVPLLPPHCSSSNGSLASAGRRKLSVASRLPDDNCSTCSEVPSQLCKYKKGSCGSLMEADKSGARDTVVRIHSSNHGNDI